MELAKYEGDVYIGRIDPTTRNFLGYFGPYETDSFEPSRDGGDTTEVKSKRRGIYDQVIYSETTGATPKLDVNIKEIPSEVLALMFAANIQDGTVTSGTVTNEVVIAPEPGGLIRLAHTNVSAVVVKDSAGTTTYVVADDYTVVDATLGALTIVESGDIEAGDTLKVSYSYAAVSADVFDGETVSSTECQVLFYGKNRISGKDFIIEYWDVKFDAPTDMIDFLSSDLATVPLTGTALTPDGKPAPYRVTKIK
jgi:hypothetical protein